MKQVLTKLQEKDLQHVWHPCSQMKDYEAFPPIVIKKGEGVWLYDEHYLHGGSIYLDMPIHVLAKH